MTTALLPFRVYWVNHEYEAHETFATIPEALAYGKSHGMEFTVTSEKLGVIVGVGLFSGTRWYSDAGYALAVRSAKASVA